MRVTAKTGKVYVGIKWRSAGDSRDHYYVGEDQGEEGIVVLFPCYHPNPRDQVGRWLAHPERIAAQAASGRGAWAPGSPAVHISEARAVEDAVLSGYAETSRAPHKASKRQRGKPKPVFAPPLDKGMQLAEEIVSEAKKLSAKD